MTNFIEEFYYGNIDPQARSFEQNKKVQRDMQILNESEDFLTEKLPGEEKKRFSRCLGSRQRRIHPRQLHHRLPPRCPVHIRYLRNIKSTLRGLPERRDINHDPALLKRQSRIFLFYRQKFRKKLVKISQIFADTGKFYYASFNRSIIFLIESLKFLSYF